MPDPQTPNLDLFIPLNGSNVGVWDVPMNANYSALDNALGAVATVALSNVPVTLSPSQYACGMIVFSGTLTADVVVTFPAKGRIFWLQNNCNSNVTFTVRAQISSANQYVCLPPNEPTAVLSDATNMKFVGLGRVGSYMDFAGSSAPPWITQSNPVPYLNCDGTTFSSATYPALRDYLGTTALPDSKGRFRANLNQGSGRLTGNAANSGLYGESSGFLQGGGNQTIPQVAIPNYALTVTDPGHLHVVSNPSVLNMDTPVVGGFLVNGGNITAPNNTAIGFTGITVNSGGSGTAYAPPAYVGGITMIRAG